MSQSATFHTLSDQASSTDPSPDIRWFVMARLAAISTIALSVFSIAGWLLKVPYLSSLGASMATMKMNTAILLLLAGISLLWQTTDRSVSVFAQYGLAFVIVMVSSLSLLEYCLAIDFGIDQLLITDQHTSTLDSPPGRMSVLTAICLALAGLVLWLYAQQQYELGQGLAVVVLVLAYAALLGYLFGVHQYYAFGRLSSIALSTTTALLLLSIGLLALHPSHGLMQAARNPYSGGLLLRSVGTYFVLTPPLLTVIYQWGINLNMFSPATGIAMLMLLFVLLTGWLFYRTANRLNRLAQQTTEQLNRMIQAEQQAEQQAELLTKISQSVQMAIATHQAVRDQNGQIINFRYTYLNEQARHWLPVTDRQVIIGQMVDAVQVDDPGGETIARMAQVVKTGEPVRFDTMLPDGRIFYNIITRLGDGTVTSFIDVTEQRQREKQAQSQAELLRSVLDGSQNAIIAFDAIRDPETNAIINFRYVLQNEANRQRVGRSDEVLLGRTMLDFFPAVIANGLLERYAQVVETGETIRFERESTYNDQTGWYAYSAVKRGDGIVLTVQDKTAEQRGEVERNQQTEQLRATLDASISSVFYMTALREPQTGIVTDFLIELANQTIERSLNMTPSEVIGKRLLEKFPGNSENGFLDLYIRVVNTGKPEQTTQPYRDALGLEGWFEVSAVKQGADGLVVTFMNVTEAKQQEQRLRESNASLDQFASVASHDLQEPLRKIQSFGNLLLTQYGPTLGDGAELLNRMHQAANRMQTLIRDLLSYSRISGGESIQHRPVNLTQLVNEVLTDLEVPVQETKAVIDISPLPTLTGNELQLRQAFQNLISNALKFNNPGQPPHLTIEARQVSRSDVPTDIRFPGKYGTYYWQITVADNGIGFDAVYRERIFGAFERLHGRSSKFSGTGIGLAIVRKVIDNHRGIIVANSQPGEGAVFTMYLPVSVPA